MKASEIIQIIETFAPLAYQESYDNSGLQVGNRTQEIHGVLLTLDITEQVIDEAINNKCNMIVAHHPVIFSGIKQLSGKNYVERIIIKAIKNDIVLYAAHTNLDNVAMGVNNKIASKLGLQNTKILAPSSPTALCKLYVYTPISHADIIREAMFAAGAGAIGNYSECSFNTNGLGTFKPSENSNPSIGTPNGSRETVNEVKIEVIAPQYLVQQILQAARKAHLYEEMAYEIIALQNVDQTIGAGYIGELPEAIALQDFLQHVKIKMNAAVIRHTEAVKDTVQRIAVCGGSGSSFLKAVFLTADFKYHQFFDAEKQLVIADIGHFESEQYTVEIFYELIKIKFPNFVVILSQAKTNPINYYY